MSDFLFNLARRSAGIAADLRARPLPPQPSLLEAPPEGTPGELAAGLAAPPAPAALPHSAPAPTVQRATLAAPPLPATPAAPSQRAPEAVRSPFSELSHGEATLPARWSPSVAARQPAPAAAPREITGDVPSHALPRVAPVRPSFAPQAEPEAVRASDSAPIEARGPIAPQDIHLSAPLPAVPSPGTRPASRPAGVGPVENPLESRPPFASASGASPTGRAALEDARLLVSARASVPAVAERGPELEAPARGGLPLTAARAEPIERTVVVHIGEIEIHGAEPPVAPAPPAAATPAPPASASAGFDDYAGLRSYTPWER